MPCLSFCTGKYTVACTTALLFVSRTYAAKFCSVKTRGFCLWKVLPTLYPADTPVNFRFTSYSQSLVLRNAIPSRQPHWPTGTVAVSTRSVSCCCCSVSHSAYGNIFLLFRKKFCSRFPFKVLCVVFFQDHHSLITPVSLSSLVSSLSARTYPLSVVL
jgi:hypothetical protein